MGFCIELKKKTLFTNSSNKQRLGICYKSSTTQAASGIKMRLTQVMLEGNYFYIKIPQAHAAL